MSRSRSSQLTYPRTQALYVDYSCEIAHYSMPTAALTAPPSITLIKSLKNIHTVKNVNLTCIRYLLQQKLLSNLLLPTSIG